MATRCISPIKARIMRLVRLDECGVPVTGVGSQIVTKGFVQIANALEYDDGTEFLLKNADGEPCVNDKDPDFLKRVTSTTDFCVMNPDAIVITTGEDLITGGAPVTGTGVAFGEDPLTARYSIEVWQPAGGRDACEGGQQQYVYWAFFNMGNTRIGDFTFANSTFIFQLISQSKVASASWANGPGTSTKWLPASFDPTGKHFAFNITTEPPPEPTGCEAVELT